MSSLSNSFSISTLFPAFNDRAREQRMVYWIVILALLMAFLELGQDYISSALNGNYFSLSQSLSYKLFWFIFVPFSLLLIHWFDKAGSYVSKGIYYLSSAFIIPLVALTHLLVFALLLHTISYVAYDQPWPLNLLLTEKLSTRLYISLSCYIVFSLVYYRLKRREEAGQNKKKSPLKSISVKNGQKNTLVNVDEVNWILSDGPYLRINTAKKEHVILDSLKNIIIDLPDNFKRIHRSTIVNIDHIKSLKSRGNGDYDVTMKCGKILRLSRNYAKPLRGLLL